MVHFSGWLPALPCARVQVRGGPVQHGSPAPCGPVRLRLLGARGRRPKPGPCVCSSSERGASCARGRRRRTPSGRALAAGSWVRKAAPGGGDGSLRQARADGDSARHCAIGRREARRVEPVWKMDFVARRWAAFLFLYFLKIFFTEIYFRFHILQFYTPRGLLTSREAAWTYM